MSIYQVEEGEETLAKVECQICGEAKELGQRCEKCGFPMIEIRPTISGRPLLFLPLCPSTNARMRPVKRGGFAQDILTEDARDYIASVGTELRWMLPAVGAKPITRWEIVWCWVILPRTSCDPHNYFKVSLDALERGGAFFDDRYALPRIGGIYFDSKEPLIIYQL